MLLSERIKEIRKAEKLTQTKFGDKLSVSRDVISSFESGRVEPKPIFLNYLCEIFNINKDWLLTGEGEMYKQLSAEEEFAFLIGHIAASDNPKLKNLINILSQIDNEQDLDLILNLCKRLSDKKEV
ncbi:helix-turn-helix transcriptional regulator [Clostridium sp. NSJ-49]|uniref:helix-turn-helix domain-containing protein n=1 Tax=Clostridium sp. NSJ-49 TaxID=2763034 RepID=UPI00164A3934|nr:helix-turn-helix transcriptional regulator [Clostridium sp. NSJ-49]MBC5624971.1 helix-turn-helix transcriptional regulator [Clostridium sp. NSJ-49]